MATVTVRRPPRRAAPEIPVGELAVAAPPELPQETGGRWQQLMMVLPMLGGSVAMAMMFGRGGGVYSYVVGAMFGVSSLAMLATSWGGATMPKRAELAAARREYLRQLAGLRRRARETALAQRDGLRYRHPDPARLWSTVDSHRLWERRVSDPDFGIVRVALGPQTLATPLVPPVTRPPDELEPMCAGALRRFLDTYSVVPELPVAVSLRAFGRIHLTGRPHPLLRAMLIQLAVFHAPDDLVIAVCAGPHRRAEWEWVKWLPHALHRTRTDAAGPVRLVTQTVAELETLLGDEPGGGHLVVVLDGADPAGAVRLTGESTGTTVLDLDREPPRVPDRSTLVLGVGDRLHSRTAESESEVGVPDGLSVAEAEAIARRLAPLRLARVETARPSGAEPGLAALLDGLRDPAARWTRPRTPRDLLRVTIGTGTDGAPVVLDLKESAQDGMGPHGLLIGATGSGKSELLRTLVLGLAAEHSPEALNFVLVDFKGGATFASLDRLPHTAAVITNLADELPLVDRMVDAINGELLRRQELLRRSGNIASLREYDRARAAGAALAPLPSLLIVCDEFSELLSAKPDFIDLFVQIGRLGRSLGVHLLLASQRLEEGRLRGLDTHLSYRIGLRTFSSLESRAVLGVPDAYELPRSPGHGYLRFGTEPLVRFKAVYVSGPYRRENGESGGPGETPARVLPYHSGVVAVPRQPRPRALPRRPEPEPAARSLLDLLVSAMEGAGPAAHRVWLPPLDAAPPLTDLLGPIRHDPRRGLSVADPDLRGTLRLPVAVVDRPLDQRREVLRLDLAGAAGHVAVVGGPQSGKSTALRTLITSLALTHTPAEAQVYCLDFGGGSLAQVQGLPHVGGVTGRLDPVGVRRTVGEVRALLTEREARFAALGVDGMQAYRALRASGEVEDDPYGDIFLVIDGWLTLRNDFDDLEPLVTEVAMRGLSYGVHVVIAAGRWMDLRPAIRDLLGSRVELRLGDPNDSTVSRRSAANVPERSPGRGITAESLHLLVARPDFAPERIAAAWTGPAAPPVRRLPERLPYAAVAEARETGLRIPIGVVETDLSPAVLDFAADPHFLLYGDGECGKTSFLRALATTITRRFAPERARILLVDFRRTLLGAVDEAHLLGHGSVAEPTRKMIEAAAAQLRQRLPGPEITARQLRDRSWWTGPELFVLVDDYELAGGTGGPLQPLADLLPQARDIGLHLVLARRAGGAGRAYDPVLQQLRELAAPGLVMSGSREDGPLLGDVRLTALPPGRGQFKTRRDGVRLIQLAYLPPDEPDEAG